MAEPLESSARRLIPAEPPRRPEDVESLDVWGFRDSGFRVNESGNVVFAGNRYAIAGQELPDLLPWVREMLAMPEGDLPVHAPWTPGPIPEPRRHAAFERDLEKFLSQDAVVRDPRVRLRHGHGHTQAEMYAIKYGSVARVPDLVVFPRTEADVAQLVRCALQHDVALIPYGGGTNVTEALRCPETETRPIVSVDLRDLDRILWIEPENRLACIQAGAIGRNIHAQLAAYGFTMGHEPDSIEHSTLGGWIATNSSGMKKNRYGNIEDLIVDVQAVTADGRLERTALPPRESTGIDPRQWLFGSEGNLGIITSAVVQISPLPEQRAFDSVLFPDFEQGVAFLHELARAGPLPASVRLLDNLQFQFGQALQPRARGAARTRRRIERLFVTRVRGFDPQRMVVCTLLFEGSRAEVKAQQRTVHTLAARHGGMRAGARNGERGYQLTFSIAYIRDFIMNYSVLAESFETSVPWSQILPLCRNVRERLETEHRVRKLPGRPALGARISVVYPTGVCVYFYFAYYHAGVERPSEVYAELENAAREEILRSGGALSHHHGVGKHRQSFLPQIMSAASLSWIAGLKQAVDPHNVFGAGNLPRR
jgi:alkyldihydroxyacetonephosphate synthase